MVWYSISTRAYGYQDLVDVACGTGKHLSFLRQDFDCVGIDASEEILKVARKNVPGIEFSKGDMVDFDSGRRFDVVLCLFSSIGYLKTRREAWQLPIWLDK